MIASTDSVTEWWLWLSARLWLAGVTLLAIALGLLILALLLASILTWFRRRQ
jgi:hypothetical protein